MVRSARTGQEGAGLGPRCRAPRPGPETDLVDRFVGSLATLGAGRRTLRTTLFREPRLMSGFPDLVAVTWHAPTAERWRGERREVTTADLRLVQFLVASGPTPAAVLQQAFGCRQLARLPLLRDAGLVTARGETWRVTRLRDAFAVRGIVAFEAKISDLGEALAQASANRWFASESYVLLAAAPRGADAASRALRLGVGIWVEGRNTPLVPAPRNAEQPVSFASWLFNEWAWRGATWST